MIITQPTRVFFVAQKGVNMKHISVATTENQDLRPKNFVDFLCVFASRQAAKVLRFD